MNETPLPLIVSATSAFGASSPARNRAKRPRSSAWSWPSHVATSQPNARSFRLEIAESEDLVRRLVRLQLVAVDDDPEPAETLVRGGLERLPVLALLQLAVAGHHDDDALRGRQRALPRRCRGPSRCPCRASPSSPRCRERRRPDGRRAHRAGAAAASRSARDHAEPVERGVQARARRAPSTRRRRRDRDRRSRPRRRSAPRRAGGRRRRAR